MIADLEEIYFEWLLTRLDPDGAREGVAYVGGLLHNCEFTRRVGNDENRAVDGINLRREFLMQFEEAEFDPHVTNQLMQQECSWFEMLIALSRVLDFQYDGGVESRFMELVENLGLGELLEFTPTRSDSLVEHDQRVVDQVTHDFDNNRFDRNGRPGLFPLDGRNHPDQRGVEIWDQHAAYFNERLEGVYF